MRSLLRRVWEREMDYLRRDRWLARGGRVDPAAFPADEFPVWCLKCGYDLHDSPSGQCPECNREYERGRLLVQTYFPWPNLPRGTGWSRMRTWALRVIIAAYAAKLIPFVIFLSITCIDIKDLMPQPDRVLAVISGLIRSTMLSYLFQLLLFLLACLLAAVGFLGDPHRVPFRRRRRAIKAWLARETPWRFIGAEARSGKNAK